MPTLAGPDPNMLNDTAADRMGPAYALLGAHDVQADELFTGLARLHPLVIVTDLEGHVLWMSDELEILRGDAGQHVGQHVGHPLCQALSSLPGARELARFSEQIAQIQNHLRHNDALDDVRLDLGEQNGLQRSLDLRAFKIETRDARTLLVTILETSGLRASSEAVVSADREVLDSLLGVCPDAVFAVNRFGFVSYANAAVESVLGLDPQKMIGQPIGLALPESGELARALSALRTSAQIDEPEVRIDLPDGAERWVGLSSRTQSRPDGSRSHTVIFGRDVTRQVLARRQLERKAAELEEYVHSVSHDLRSPLVSLLGFTRLLRQDYDHVFDETGRHFAERIEESGRTMQTLIEDLLELSRIGASGERHTLVDPRSVLLQLQAELKLRLEECGASLHFPQSPPLLLCDRTRLYQLFSNLVGNAMQHMGDVEDRRIDVSIEEREAEHVITVTDRGVGIHPEEQERIFDVFHSCVADGSGVADGSSVAEGSSPGEDSPPAAGSSGVGLAIVKRIADTHGGRVWVESEPGNGARFKVSLPHSL
jgi:PAS domain S-box-containing protein